MTDSGWTTVAGESPEKIILDTIGDEFIGTFTGFDHVQTDDGQYDFEQAVFRANGEKPNLAPGLYAIGGFKVLQALHAANPVGKLVRLRYVKDLPMSGTRSAMKDVTVEVANSSS